MHLTELEWDDENEGHLARHGVTPEEVEEVLFFNPVVRRTRQGRYLAFNQTLAGRHLLVVFAYLRDQLARPITARDMDQKERRTYGKWRGGKK